MDERIEKWMYDILGAIEEIEDFFDNAPKLYADFQRDIRTRRAVERNIEIIGEAMSRILKTDNTVSITNARKIVDARNYIIHGYDSLAADILWNIVINHLPLLKAEIKTFVEK